MDQILVDAYRTADYVVSDRRHEVVIRIGKRSHEVDALLARYSARSAVFITAWNPFSRSLTRGRNEYRQRCLLARISHTTFVRSIAICRDFPACKTIMRVRGTGRGARSWNFSGLRGSEELVSVGLELMPSWSRAAARVRPVNRARLPRHRGGARQHPRRRLQGSPTPSRF